MLHVPVPDTNTFPLDWGCPWSGMVPVAFLPTQAAVLQQKSHFENWKTHLTVLIFLKIGTGDILPYSWQKDQSILLWARGSWSFVAGMNYCSVFIQTSEHLYPIFTGTTRYLAQPQKGMFSYKGLKYALICCCVIFWYSQLLKKKKPKNFITEVLPLSICLALAQNEMN